MRSFFVIWFFTNPSFSRMDFFSPLLFFQAGRIHPALYTTPAQAMESMPDYHA
jgi:hypothetical protein